MTVYKTKRNAVITNLDNNLYYFGISTKIPKLLSTLMKLAHKREELFAIYGSLNIEIEAVLELALGNLTALELDEVHTCSVEA